MFLFKYANFDLQKDGGLGTVLVSNEAQIISCFVFFGRTRLTLTHLYGWEGDGDQSA